MEPSVYIETSVISYLPAKPSRDLIVASHQQITVDWWDQVRPNLKCFVSDFVIQEAERGNATYAQKRLEAIKDFPVLELSGEIKDLAQKYFAAILIPERAKVDAFHLAVAAWHRMDYLLSWNCTHIASGRVRRIVRDINDGLGVHTPTICTPEELMEV
ncbi:MAG: type II toxin-antitoxin system VapC family toxin [Acidobacteria bacterium]|nr:type II toxin-antitoxin system VapC family toxin [Acidobacteriota bacterium]MBI3657398.1 type II toxin-antitoxin system VapC family toxin [Acidobacteriota bacterium]